MSDSPTPAQPQNPHWLLEEPDLLPPFGGWRGQDEPEEVAASETRARDASAALPPVGRSGYEQILAARSQMRAARSAARTRVEAAGAERQAPAPFPPEDMLIDRGSGPRRPRVRRLRPVLAFSGLLAAPAFAGLILAAAGMPQLPAIFARKSVPATAHAPAWSSAIPGAEARISGNGALVLAQGDGDAPLLAADQPFEETPRATELPLLASGDADSDRSLSASPMRGFPNTTPSAEGLGAEPASRVAGNGGETPEPPRDADMPAAVGAGDTELAPEPPLASASFDWRPDLAPDLAPGQDAEATGDEVSFSADEEAPAFASIAPEPLHPEVVGGALPPPGADHAPDLLEAGERVVVGPASAHDSARLPKEPESAAVEPAASDRPSDAEAAGGTLPASPLPATSDASGAVPVPAWTPAVVPEQAITLDAATDQAPVLPQVDEALDDRPPSKGPVPVEPPDASASGATPAIATSASPTAPSDSVKAEEVPSLETVPDAAPRLSSIEAIDRSGAMPNTEAVMRDAALAEPVPSAAVPHPAAPEPGGEAPAQENGARRRDPTPPPALVEALVARGDAMVARRDISAARLLYERAAAAGSARAAAALARAHDPEFLAGIGAQGIRGDAALARAWHQKAASLTEPAPTPAPASAPSALVEALVARGDAMVARRDISAARLLYERAAAAGSARAAAALARTHDPEFLAGIGAQGVRGDAALARAWHQKAVALGDGRAPKRAEALRGRDHPP